MTSASPQGGGQDERGGSRLRPVTPVGIAADEIAHALTDLEALGGGTAGSLDVESLRGRLTRAHVLLAGLDDYVSQVTSPESAQLADLARHTRDHRWGEHPEGAAALEPEMLSGHVEAALLQLLVRVSRARRVLEIGTFTGYAALAVAEALPTDGRVVTCEADPRAAAVAAAAFADAPDGHLVELREGPALATLHDLVGDAPFDLVFVDADKGAYTDYLDAILDGGLLAAGGLVAVDNTLMQGTVYGAEPRSTVEAAQGEALAAFNRRVADDPRLVQVLLPVRDGLTLLQHVPGDDS